MRRGLALNASYSFMEARQEDNEYEDVTLYNFELNSNFSGVEESKATLKLLK
jgi:hypothetical protein